MIIKQCNLHLLAIPGGYASNSTKNIKQLKRNVGYRWRWENTEYEYIPILFCWKWWLGLYREWHRPLHAVTGLYRVVKLSGFLWARWHQVGSLKLTMVGVFYTTEIGNLQTRLCTQEPFFRTPLLDTDSYSESGITGSTLTSIAGLYEEFCNLAHKW